VPRASTNADAFNAIAEPQRRAILEAMIDEERSATAVAGLLAPSQSSVSKHLRVLRDVGLVESRRDGRQMWYRTSAHVIRPLYEWACRFERSWHQQRRASPGLDALTSSRQESSLQNRHESVRRSAHVMSAPPQTREAPFVGDEVPNAGALTFDHFEELEIGSSGRIRTENQPSIQDDSDLPDPERNPT
jgi:DNA-binding transcriptional ArsR family regulator